MCLVAQAGLPEQWRHLSYSPLPERASSLYPKSSDCLLPILGASAQSQLGVRHVAGASWLLILVGSLGERELRGRMGSRTPFGLRSHVVQSSCRDTGNASSADFVIVWSSWSVLSQTEMALASPGGTPSWDHLYVLPVVERGLLVLVPTCLLRSHGGHRAALESSLGVKR